MKKEIINLLKLKQGQFELLQFETAMQYLENYLDGNRNLVNDFAKHPGFWNWWKRQYDIVDTAFLGTYQDTDFDTYQLHGFYIQMHLTMDKHIDKVLWDMIESDRDAMTHQLIKKEVNHD